MNCYSLIINSNKKNKNKNKSKENVVCMLYVCMCVKDEEKMILFELINKRERDKKKRNDTKRKIK